MLSFGKTVLLGCILCGAVPVACGDSEETPASPGGAGEGGSPDGGNGGRSGSASNGGAPEIPGIGDTPQSLSCDARTCTSASIAILNVYVDPCCAGADQDACGLDTGFLSLVGASFEDSCQAKAQPGQLDAACPNATGLQVPIPNGMATLDALPGCCRAETGKCGVLVDTIKVQGLSVADFGLGCVDAEPFFQGVEPATCGSATPGAGGSDGGSGAGAGGAPSGGTPSGGAPAGGAGAGGAP